MNNTNEVHTIEVHKSCWAVVGGGMDGRSCRESLRAITSQLQPHLPCNCAPKDAKYATGVLSPGFSPSFPGGDGKGLLHF